MNCFRCQSLSPLSMVEWSACIISHTADCPDLPSLTNGMIMYSAGSTNNRPLGSRATHSCNTGYTLTGSATIRICVTGGRWNGSPPTCQGEFCNSCTVCVDDIRVNNEDCVNQISGCELCCVSHTLLHSEHRTNMP